MSRTEGIAAENSKSRIMLVDDEIDILVILKKSLELADKTRIVETFSDPKSALDAFSLNKDAYSLIISDIRMPQLSGFLLSREIKRLNPVVKIILMSAFDMSQKELESEMPSTPIDAFVRKPISAKDFVALISRHEQLERTQT